MEAEHVALPRTAVDAARRASATAQRMVMAGFVVAAAIVVVCSARLVLSPAGGSVGSWLAAGLLVAISLLTVIQRHRAVALLARRGGWLPAWSALVVVCFALDGPGDELLLPAAMVPVGLAGLLGRPLLAVCCALIVDAGYLGLLAAEGGAAVSGAGLHLAAANASSVLMVAVSTSLPVRLGLTTRRQASALVQAFRLGASDDELAAIGRGGRRWRWRDRLLPLGPQPAMLPRYASEIPGPMLSPQEQRVLMMVRQGYGYKQIALAEAQLLGQACSKHRVRKVMAAIKRKVGASTRNEIAALSLAEFRL